MAENNSKQALLVKILVVIYVAYLVTIFAVYFAVSNRDIQISAFIQSADQWEVARPNALRAIFLNAPTGRTFSDGLVEMFFAGERTTPNIPSHGHVHVSFSPDQKTTGDQELKVVFTARGEDPFEVDSKLTVKDRNAHVPKFSKRRVEPESKKKLVPSWEGSLKVGLLPTGVELARGLENTFYFVVYDATTNEPVRSSITISEVEGLLDGELKREYRTDSAGVAVAKIKPNTTIRLTLEVTEFDGERTGAGKVNIFTVPSQFKIVPSDLIVRSEGAVEGSVQSLHRSGALFVDVYEHGVWRVADGFGVRKKDTGFRTKIPPVDAPFVRVQIYHNLFDAGRAWDVVNYAIGDRDDCAGALRRVGAVVASSKSEQAPWARSFLRSSVVTSNSNARNCRRWLHAMLLAIPAEFTKVPVLINSQERDRKELEAWRAEVQGDLKIATGLALFVGLLVVFLIALQGIARSREQERLFQEVDAELEDGEVLEVGGAERFLVLMRVVIIFVTLVLFAGAVMMLLNFM